MKNKTLWVILAAAAAAVAAYFLLRKKQPAKTPATTGNTQQTWQSTVGAVTEWAGNLYRSVLGAVGGESGKKVAQIIGPNATAERLEGQATIGADITPLFSALAGGIGKLFGLGGKNKKEAPQISADPRAGTNEEFNPRQVAFAGDSWESNRDAYMGTLSASAQFPNPMDFAANVQSRDYTGPTRDFATGDSWLFPSFDFEAAGAALDAGAGTQSNWMDGPAFDFSGQA